MFEPGSVDHASKRHSTKMYGINTQNSIVARLSMGAYDLHSYTPYGTRKVNVTTTALGYMGEFFDSVLSAYLFGKGYRIYSPSCMRFMKPDESSPFERGGINAYSAFSGDPINKIDPDGHQVRAALKPQPESMIATRAAARFKSALQKKRPPPLKNLPLLQNNDEADTTSYLLKFKEAKSVSHSEFRLAVKKDDIVALTGPERKFILTQSGSFITGNPNKTYFPHPLLTYFAKSGDSVVAAGYIAMRQNVAIISSRTGHYYQSAQGLDTLKPVTDFLTSLGVKNARLRGGEGGKIPLFYAP